VERDLLGGVVRDVRDEHAELRGGLGVDVIGADPQHDHDATPRQALQHPARQVRQRREHRVGVRREPDHVAGIVAGALDEADGRHPNSRVARRKGAGRRRWRDVRASRSVAIGVNATRPLRMTLEVEPDADPIRGVLDDGRGSRAFEGWLALTQALEAALRSARGDEEVSP
jgi:hypothetical protein